MTSTHVSMAFDAFRSIALLLCLAYGVHALCARRRDGQAQQKRIWDLSFRFFRRAVRRRRLEKPAPIVPPAPVISVPPPTTLWDAGEDVESSRGRTQIWESPLYAERSSAAPAKEPSKRTSSWD